MNFRCVIFGCLALASFPSLAAPIAFHGDYREDFDALGTVSVDEFHLDGWQINQVGLPVNDGSNGEPGIFNFGVSADRALGGRATEETGYFHYVLSLRNDTGSAISNAVLHWTIELWHDGGSTNRENIGLSYGFGEIDPFSTAPGDGWRLSIVILDIKDGYPIHAYTTIAGSWDPGEVLHLRWTELPGVLFGDGFDSVAIDDVHLIIPEPRVPALILLGSILLCAARRRAFR